MKKKEASIVCYSYSGRTYWVAKEIQGQTGGQLYEIYPRQPYPMNYEELLAVVQKNRSQGIWPKIFPTEEIPENVKYLFIGTPNWCGKIAPPMETWLYQNKLAGKIILPFYTYCRTGEKILDLEKHLKKICPDCEVKQSMGIYDDQQDYKEQIKQWLEEVAVDR